jgi:hypothetical protein
MHAERRHPSAANHRFRGGYHRASLTLFTWRASSSRGTPSICLRRLHGLAGFLRRSSVWPAPPAEPPRHLAVLRSRDQDAVERAVRRNAATSVELLLGDLN